MEIGSLPHIDTIRFERVTFCHEGHDPTLKSCDFTFPPDQIVWLKSHEGAGKTTLLQVMAGLLIPQSGRYFLNDVNAIDMSFEEFLPYRLRIGFTFDYGGLINNRSLTDNLLLPLLYHNLVTETEARLRVNDLIERFDLQKFAKERPAHVPGRIRKMTVLLRGLVTWPQVLLLDDPSVGLGEATAVNFAELIREMRRQGHLRHVFISSYDQKFMSMVPHSVVQMDQGLLYHHVTDGTGMTGGPGTGDDSGSFDDSEKTAVGA